MIKRINNKIKNTDKYTISYNIECIKIKSIICQLFSDCPTEYHIYMGDSCNFCKNYKLTKIARNRIIKYYRNNNFKVEYKDFKIIVSWNHSQTYKKILKKFKKVVNAIIFIRRLRESFLKLDGSFHKSLKNKYSSGPM